MEFFSGLPRRTDDAVKTLYIDAPMGISGDMFLGALINMGVDPGFILRELKKLHADRIDVRITSEVRHSISCTAFRVRIHDTHHHRTFRDIRAMINGSRLSTRVKELSTAIFRKIAVAEGAIHGISADKVHFHEVGAMDSIIDIVGAAIAVDSTGARDFISSPIPLGTGWTNTMHGTLPVPAPATLELLKGVPIAPSTAPFELTTPTGAAIIKTLATRFGPMPSIVIEKVGYGAGKKDFKDAANVLRLVLGDSAPGAAARSGEDERLIVMETNIDDMTPQLCGYLMERLLEGGALDAYLTPVQMKKSRPGVLLTVLTDEKTKDALEGMIFDESTTIGIRSYRVQRSCLERKIRKVKTPYGVVRVKVSSRGGRAVNIQPEYEDCRAIAVKNKVPLKDVLDAARAAAASLKS